MEKERSISLENHKNSYGKPVLRIEDMDYGEEFIAECLEQAG